jgi:large subunit ribosomal protein L31e
MAEKELERIYVVPLNRIKNLTAASRAAPGAVKEIKRFLMRHMKVEKEKIWIDNSVNERIWSRSKYKIPSKVRIRAIKFDDGIVEVSLPELELKASRREEIKAARETKKPILRKEEEKPAEKKEEEEATTKAKDEEKTEEAVEAEESKTTEVTEEAEETKEDKDKQKNSIT